MSVIWTPSGAFSRVGYTNEADLESAITLVQRELFGPNRYYLDVKKKVGAKGGKRNIPDGYLIDLNGQKPLLYVVENELAAHDPLRHISMQILEFSLAFESDQRLIKTILFNALQELPDVKAQCERYAINRGYRNLDYLLDVLVFDVPFTALVIIDEMPEKLENVLARKFRFGVEVLELARYENLEGARLYLFEPFLADVSADAGIGVTTTSVQERVDLVEIDTVVVPAQEDGFQETFLHENRWHAVRIHGAMRPQIKYIAAYRTAPTSAITHIAPVASIEPWQDTGKVVVNFSESAQPIGPISLVRGGRVKAPQNLRYTSLEKLRHATTLDDLW